MAHKKWMHIYWKRFEFNACLPTADLPAPMIYFPRSLRLHHFFCRTSGSCFVSAIATAAAAPYQRHSLPLLFILSRAVFSSRRQEYYYGISRLMTVCGLPSLLVNPATAEGPFLRRAVARRINSACDSRRHDCRCAGRHVIFWHTHKQKLRRGVEGVVAAAVSSGSVMHHPCWRGLFTRAVVGLLSPTLPLCAALNGRGCSYTSAGIVCSLFESPEREAGATPPPHTPPTGVMSQDGRRGRAGCKRGADSRCLMRLSARQYVRNSPKFSSAQGREKVQLSLIQAVNKATCWGLGLCSPLWVRMLNSDFFCLFVLFFSRYKWNETAIRPTLTVHRPEVKATRCVYRRKYGRTHVVGDKIMTEWW